MNAGIKSVVIQPSYYCKTSTLFSKLLSEIVSNSANELLPHTKQDVKDQ